MTPLVFILAFLSVTLARSFWLWRTTGLNPYVIDHQDPLHRFVAHVFFVAGFGLLAYFVAIVVAPGLESRMGLLAWAVSDVTRWSGAALMAVATVWTGYAQFAMGPSWRIGIPN